MSKAPRPAKTIEHDPSEHPTQGAVPPMPAEMNGAGEQPETSLADVAENHPGYFYKPVQGVVSTDVLEVALMLCLQIFAPHVEIQTPGALRNQIMSGERYEKLSPDAQRHMKSVA